MTCRVRIFLTTSLLVCFVCDMYTAAKAFSFDKQNEFQLLRIYTNMASHIPLLEAYERNNPAEVRIIKKSDSHGDGAVDVLVAPSHADYMHQLVKLLRLHYEMGPASAFDTPRPGARQHDHQHVHRTRSVPARPLDMPLDQYHTYNDITNWLKALAKQYDNIMSVFEIGRTWEDRPILAVKLSSTDAQRISLASKPAIWLDAGMHSNEWIGPATLIYFIKQLVTKYGEDTSISRHLELFDWFIVPVVNVDGYVYTWTHDRLWRKSRSTRSNDTGCVGVDMNRNWDIGWEDHLGAGVHRCSRIYPGPRPFSEPELRAIVAFLRKHPNVLAAVSYHSCGQFWMTPYGYRRGQRPRHFDTLMSISNDTVNAIYKVHGTRYETGSIQEIFGVTSGSSVDYLYSRLGVRYTFGVELRDKGNYCALLPPQQIIANAEESFAGIRCLSTLVARRSRLMPTSEWLMAAIVNC